MESQAVNEIGHVIPVTDLQVPLGDLIDVEMEGIPTISSTTAQVEPQTMPTFRTIAKSIMPIPLNEIIPYEGVPDYREPTSAEYPLVVVTPLGKFGIDGMELVHDAISAGAKETLCEIEIIEEHSDIELCIRKAASRIATRGGLASYSEIVRNVTAAKKQLETSGRYYQAFGHGGNRHRKGSADESQENLTDVLALRFTRKTKTITNYINHGEDLSDDVLQRLVEMDAPKQFYEKCQKKKQRLIKGLKQQGVAELERVEQVSTLMLEFLDEYLAGQLEEDQGSCGQEQPETPAPQSGTPQVPQSAPDSLNTVALQSIHEDEEEDEYAIAESEDGGNEAPARLANNDEEGDDVLFEPEVDRDEGPAQSSSSNEVVDDGYSTIEDEQAPSPRAMTIEDIYDAIDSVAERLADLPDMDLSPVAMARSIEEEIGILNDLRQQLLRIED